MKQSKYFSIFILCIVLCSVLVVPSFAELKVANDPTRLGVGARPLGLGKAFVAIDADPSSMFVNPAGISTSPKWQVTSMSGNFINEVNYTQLGGVYPTDFGTFGLGYIGSGLSFTAPVSATIEVSGEIRVFPSTNEGTASYNYSNTAIILAYGVQLERFFDHDILKHILMGANFKLFYQGLSGGTIYGGTGSGYEMDVGMIYKPSNIFSLGLTVENALPASMGGKFIWPAYGTRTTDIVETYPANLKMGLAYKIMGKDTLFKAGEQELKWLLDVDRAVMLSSMPTLIHTGLEWNPVKMLAIRFGLDQDIIGLGATATEVSNNFSGGVGLTWGEFRFDYAYHQYNDIADNDTHYFSFSYDIGKEEKPHVYFELLSPKDKSIVYDKTLKFEGKIIDKKVAHIIIDGKVAKINKDGTFTADVPARVAKNIYLVSAFDKEGQELTGVPIQVVRLLTFKDINKDYWGKLPVEYLATLGIIAGYPDGTFRPEGNITRAELSTLLVRSKKEEIPAALDDVFLDMGKGHWASKYIKLAVDSGYVKGYPDNTFKPSRNINRVEGIVLISRYAELKEPLALIESPFPDLPGRHWAAKDITAAKQGGLLKYLGGQRLEPLQALTRGEAAEIISKTSFIDNKIHSLTTFQDISLNSKVIKAEEIKNIETEKKLEKLR
ncbi:MAG: S-layer homology domain-containing protein [Candidatus Margulisbacteria bacterium]|nr:S-layer homology domain-containing protein [Candidatus Margulisiibacteriota bacterium]MBU1022560.1 S-layer homology domain-containing protein [Candidatus Margulisiibacteriota bacterium]MBU1728846.1 S-layer homology domain-containing protein [Candidatus Margulisiibacteriota bacterium]MBU1955477.1 S-layer homology domain-containing protein [Candidatus Margulisiibacteriota bacterium]